MGACIKSDKSRYKVAANANIKARDQISLNASGFAVPAPAPSAGVTGTVAGSAIEDVDNTGGADGDKLVTVEHSLGETAFLLSHVGLTEADVCAQLYVGANPKQVTKTATNAVKSGILQGIEDDGRARVIFPL